MFVSEGKVVVYSMALGAPYYVAVLKSFEAKYGIKVESLDLRASELAERVRTEQAAGRFLGDAEIITTTAPACSGSPRRLRSTSKPCMSSMMMSQMMTAGR